MSPQWRRPFQHKVTRMELSEFFVQLIRIGGHTVSSLLSRPSDMSTFPDIGRHTVDGPSMQTITDGGCYSIPDSGDTGQRRVNDHVSLAPKRPFSCTFTLEPRTCNGVIYYSHPKPCKSVAGFCQPECQLRRRENVHRTRCKDR